MTAPPALHFSWSSMYMHTRFGIFNHELEFRQVMKPNFPHWIYLLCIFKQIILILYHNSFCKMCKKRCSVIKLVQLLNGCSFYISWAIIKVLTYLIVLRIAMPAVMIFRTMFKCALSLINKHYIGYHFQFKIFLKSNFTYPTLRYLVGDWL